MVLGSLMVALLNFYTYFNFFLATCLFAAYLYVDTFVHRCRRNPFRSHHWTSPGALLKNLQMVLQKVINLVFAIIIPHKIEWFSMLLLLAKSLESLEIRCASISFVPLTCQYVLAQNNNCAKMLIMKIKLIKTKK